MQIIESRRPVRPVLKTVEYYELAESIKKHGLLTPILVRPWNGKLEIVDGHRRYRICRELGIEPTFCEREMTDLGVAVAQIQLNHLETVEKRTALFRLISNFSLDNFDSVVYSLGEHRSRVLQDLGLESLAAEVRTAVEAGLISLQVARLLCKLSKTRQRELLSDSIDFPVSTMVDKLQREVRTTWQDNMARRLTRKNSPDEPYLRSQKEIHNEVIDPVESMRLITLTGAKTAYDGFQLALKWALKLDPDSKIRRNRNVE